MFDLESAIADWRRQMLAAGITTPVPLEELELHLREEIERQIQTGATEQNAFEMAAKQVGQPTRLKAEFRKAGGFLDWLGEDRAGRTHRALALLWLAYCSSIFFSLAAQLAVFPSSISIGQGVSLVNVGLVLVWLILVVCLRGMVASVRFFGGNLKEARTLRLLAILGLIAFIAQVTAFKNVSVLAIVYTLFNLISLWLLHSSKKAKPLFE